MASSVEGKAEATMEATSPERLDGTPRVSASTPLPALACVSPREIQLAAARERIRKLRRNVVQCRLDALSDISKLIQEELYCSICLGIPSSVKLLQCNHWFCASCIGDWFKMYSSCPLCRTRTTACTGAHALDAFIERLTKMMADAEEALQSLLQDQLSLEDTLPSKDEEATSVVRIPGNIPPFKSEKPAEEDLIVMFDEDSVVGSDGDLVIELDKESLVSVDEDPVFVSDEDDLVVVNAHTYTRDCGEITPAGKNSGSVPPAECGDEEDSPVIIEDNDAVIVLSDDEVTFPPAKE